MRIMVIMQRQPNLLEINFGGCPSGCHKRTSRFNDFIFCCDNPEQLMRDADHTDAADRQ